MVLREGGHTSLVCLARPNGVHALLDVTPICELRVALLSRTSVQLRITPRQCEREGKTSETCRDAANAPLGSQPRHELVCGIASFFDPRAELDRHWYLAECLVHPDDDLP
jgi:hypothetical protein